MPEEVDQADAVAVEEEKSEEQEAASVEVGKKRMTRPCVVAVSEPKKRGRKPARRDELPDLLLSHYFVDKPSEVLMKVDKQVYFESILFTRKESAPASLAASIRLSVGEIVLLLPFGDVPFVIKALYSTGKGIIYKMTGDPVVGGASAATSDTDKLPKPTKVVEHVLSDITKVMTEKVKVDPAEYPTKKKETVNLRKQRHRAKVRRRCRALY